jgi:MFS family permease
LLSTRSSVSQMFSALHERDFRWYFVGHTSFFFAMQMNQLLRGYLAFQLTKSAVGLGLIAITMGISMLLVAPLGGVIADRYNKRTLLIGVQLFVAVVNSVLAVLIITDLIEFEHLLVGTLGLGVSISIAMPARQAMVPALVPRHRMMNAISLQMGSMNLTRIVGPAIGALLIVPLGIGGAWAFGVALYLVSVFALFPLPRFGMVATRKPTGFRRELSDGFRYVARHPQLRLLIAAGMMMPLFAFPVQLVLPVFAEEVFEQGPGALGALMAVAGVGGLAGALIAANLDRVSRKSLILLVGTVIMSISYIVFAQSTSLGLTRPTAFALGLVTFGIGNVGGMLFMTTNDSTIQALVSDELRGRVMSLLMMSFGIMPLGIFPIALAVDKFGAPATVAVSSTLMLASLLLFFALSPRLRNLSVDALAHAELSPVQASALVAQGKISQDDAERLTGRQP